MKAKSMHADAGGRPGGTKGVLLTLLMVILFVLMLSEVITYVLINVNYNSLAQSASAATNQGAAQFLIVQTAKQTLQASLGKALSVLAAFEATPSLRHTVFINNSRRMLASLMMNGTVYKLNESSLMGSSLMGNLSSMLNAKLAQEGTTVSIRGGSLSLFQNNSQRMMASYSALAIINTSTGSFTLPIYAVANVSLNNTRDILLAEQQIPSTISIMNGLPAAKPIGGATAVSGSTSRFMFVYGTAVVIPGAPSCVGVPAKVRSSGYILVVSNAINIPNTACGMGGLVANNVAAAPFVPYLAYLSNSPVFNTISNGTQVMIDGKALELLDVSPIQTAIQNNYYYGSQFLPSYLSSLQGPGSSAGYGLFGFASLNRTTAYFTDNPSGTTLSNVLVPSASAPAIANQFTISMWVYKNNEQYDCPALLSDSAASNLLIYVDPVGGGGCAVGSGNTTYVPLSFQYTDVGGSSHTLNSIPIQAQTWTNIAVAFGANSLAWYVNGNLDSQTTGLINPPATSGALLVGAGITSGYYSFNGSIADVQIYNAPLTQQSIFGIYTGGINGAPVNSSELAAWYPLNGNGNDYSSYNLNGTAAPNVLFKKISGYSADPFYSSTLSAFNASPAGGALNCATPSQCSNLLLPHLYLQNQPLSASRGAVVNESSALGIAGAVMPRVLRFSTGVSAPNAYVGESRTLPWLEPGTQPFTFSIWVYPTTTNGVILDEYNSSLGITSPYISIDSGLAKIGYRKSTGGVVCDSLGAIPMYQWTNIAYTYDGSTTVTGWMNGNQVFHATGATTRNTLTGPAYYLLGGGSPTGGTCGSNKQFGGMLADFQVYNAVLTGAQAQSLYLNDTVSGVPANMIMQLSSPYQSNLNTTAESVYNNYGIFYSGGVRCSSASVVAGSCGIQYAAP